MSANTYRERIRPHIERELERSAALEQGGNLSVAFQHLERAHVLGQQDTHWHVVVHQAMLGFAARQGNTKEVAGQVLRIVGAASKTPLGIYPTGNTGGANISPLKTLPIPSDLQVLIDEVREG
jgi:hypothetical protein